MSMIIIIMSGRIIDCRGSGPSPCYLARKQVGLIKQLMRKNLYLHMNYTDNIMVKQLTHICFYMISERQRQDLVICTT